MKFKAVFLDIDGTLVSFKTHRIPESAIEAIHRVRQRGVKVFIATGRPLPFINNLDHLEYDGIMSVNGACCMEASGKVFYKHPVPPQDISRLVADAKDHPMPIIFTGNERAISVNAACQRSIYEKVFSLLAIPLPQEILDIEEVRQMDVLQVVSFFPFEQEERIQRDVLPNCEITRWHPAFVDCVARGVNKASGIDEFCRHYGFDISQTIAFGDGGNDIEMLRHAGVGVAMGNASEEVKEAADVVADSVDDDGVAKMLYKLMSEDIRHATMADLEAVTALEEACFPPTEAASRESFEWRLRTYPQHFLVMEAEGKIVSFVNGPVTREADLADEMFDSPAYCQDDAEWQMIFGVATHPDYQHQGLASLVMRQFIHEARQQHRRGVVLTCKEAKIGFYASFGFVDEGLSASNHGGVPWHQMRLVF